MQGVIATFFRLLLLSNRCVAAPLASPCIGQKPVSVLTVDWILHEKKSLSIGKAIENTLSFALILRAFS